jgi:phosphotriesterase-related protein
MKKIILAALVVIIQLGCGSNEDEMKINTVKSYMNSTQMGTTLVHEHILVDFIGADKTGYHRWSRTDVIKKVTPYLMELKKIGVTTLFECTPAYLGRDVVLLKMLSDRTGVNIITNTGLYGAVDDKYIPEYAYEISADSLASTWIKEFKNGIDGTNIKPGFIKISVDTNDVLSSIDEKIVKAAILTHKTTDLTIVSHTTADKPAFAQLNLLAEMGVSPSAWVWTHAGECTSEGRLEAAKQGAWISIDNINKEELDDNIKILVELKSEGYLNQTLISHDAGWFDPDQEDGGEFRGYTDIFTHLIPALKNNGFSEEDINQLIIENPKKAYTVKVKENN